MKKYILILLAFLIPAVGQAYLKVEKDKMYFSRTNRFECVRIGKYNYDFQTDKYLYEDNSDIKKVEKNINTGIFIISKENSKWELNYDGAYEYTIKLLEPKLNNTEWIQVYP